MNVSRKLLQPVHNVPGWLNSCHFLRKLTLNHRFQEGDNVIVSTSGPDSGRLLYLKPGKVFDTQHGSLKHDDIIGKRPRDVTSSATRLKTSRWNLYEPALEQYVRMTPRQNTPIYGADASLIVSLLDLHPDPPDTSTSSEVPEQPFEILEAGTGHGSLTLYLARAIHAANGSPPQLLVRPQDDAGTSPENGDSKFWKASRQAFITSVDNNLSRSKNARQVVGRFRRGMYLRNIDFHVGQAIDHLGDESRYAHIIFDLPAPDKMMKPAARSLRVNGSLMLWVPSITQILESLQTVKSSHLPLRLDKVVECGPGISSGKYWDVRFARIRALDRERESLKEQKQKELQNKAASTEEDCNRDYTGVLPDSIAEKANTQSAEVEVFEPQDNPDEDELKPVCRPRVGDVTFGGGFLGVFRRVPNSTSL